MKRASSRVSGGFGFDPDESVSHFLVSISSSNRVHVDIGEHLRFDAEEDGSSGGVVRVRLARAKWDAIADAIRVEFNQRLKRMGKKPGRWKTGGNHVARLLGKELVLLAWAIEDADPALIPTAIANWIGLVPEERWWLFTMTAAATGHFSNDRGRGWRKAVRFALTENPATLRDGPVVPEFFQLVADRESGTTPDTGSE